MLWNNGCSCSLNYKKILMAELSIIIPVYNTEKTLEKCVESVISQSYVNWEIILVDDGSTDGCPRICDKLAEDYIRIKVIHKNNGGLSSARNAGLDIAKGEYITFLDSDDEYAPDMLFTLMKKVNDCYDCDIMEYPVIWNKGDASETEYNFEERKYSYFISYWSEGKGYDHCWAWNKIFKACIFEKVRFTEGVLFEDVDFMGKLSLLNPKIFTVSSGLYYYYYNPSGISKQYDKRLLTLLDTQLKIVKSNSIDLSKDRWHTLYMALLNVQIDAYIITGKILLPDVKVRIKKYNTPLSLLKSLMVRFWGVKKTCIIMKYVKQ